MEDVERRSEETFWVTKYDTLKVSVHPRDKRKKKSRHRRKLDIRHWYVKKQAHLGKDEN